MSNRGWLCLLASVLCASVSTRAVADEAADRFWIKAPDAAGAVQRAIQGARRKLQNEKCRAVLSDFTDVGGRPLLQRLDELGLAAADYLAFVIIRSADESPAKTQSPCLNSGTLAFTTPGSRVVDVCAARFVASAPGDAENALIHEMLHTLGLGENPPSSSAITQRVRKRCGY